MANAAGLLFFWLAGAIAVDWPALTPGADPSFGTRLQVDGKATFVATEARSRPGATKSEGTITRSAFNPPSTVEPSQDQSAGAVDLSFDPGANGLVRTIAVQADGKILVGGDFTMLGGGGSGATARNRIGRFNADGTLDAAFNPGANGNVHAIVVQPDGKILVGGAFTSIGSSAGFLRGIARLNSDGSNDFNFSQYQFVGTGVFAIVQESSLDVVVGGVFDSIDLPRSNIARQLASARGAADTGFNPGANGEVTALALQADGKILVGGGFTTLGGGGTGTTPRSYFGRLNPDGSIDPTFNPSPNFNVRSIAVQTDGKILVAGWFTAIANASRARLARLNTDGTLDTSFTPALTTSADVEVVRPLVDGRILVGGYMTVAGVGGVQRRYVVLLNQNGALVPEFDSQLNGGVESIATQPDGKVLVGGVFTTAVSGSVAINRRFFARLHAPSLSAGTITGTPATLRFAATKNGAGGDLVAQTGAQSVTVTYTGTTAPQWTATSNQTWAVVSNATGTGAGTFTVSIANPSNVIGGATSLSATITLAAGNTGASTTIAVQLAVTQQTGTTTGPTGQVDTPAQSATGLQGAIAMTGWVVDDVGIQHVRLYRQCLAFDTPGACQTVLGANAVLMGAASIIPGARPDVEALFPTLPANDSAGWGFLILSNLLPNIPASNANGGGVGTFQFYAVATDAEGNQRLLGRSYVDSVPLPTTVTVANDTIAKPFGAIDTPEQGQTVSGTLNNFGWALTPDPGTGVLVPTNGSTVNVLIDGVVVGQASYNLCRGSVAVGGVVPSGQLCDDDVSTIFRGAGTLYRNLDASRGPIGLRTINTTSLSNGLHTIQWGVTDSASRGEGIGSRYFNVLNSATDAFGARPDRGPYERAALRTDFVARRDLPRRDDVVIYGRTGFNLDRALVPVEPVGGVPSVVIPELGRVELQVPGARGVAVVANGHLREAPVGLAVNSEDGVVTWSVGPGYLGTYRLLVEREDDHVLVDVTVAPMAVVEEPVRMHLDRVDQFGSVFVLHGWALDPQADTGSGIGAVHVWAKKKTSGVFFEDNSAKKTPDVFFLGTADMSIARPDVAAAHGARFPNAGFSFQSALGEGEWEVIAYAWNSRTARFEDARSATVTVR
jgi:uncharacterized delta-60 repeat protein